MTPIELIRSYGHEHNPAFSGRTPTDGELIRSYQQMMAPEHEQLCQSLHARDPWFDGELGPATEALLALDRCGCPDFLPLAEEATGSGSWAVGCLADYPDIHAIYYHLDESRMPSQTKSWWDEIEEMVHEAYADMGLKLVRTENKAQAQLHVSFQNLGGNIIGLAQLPPQSASASCQRGYFCKLDPGYRPNITQISTLWAHEFGHNMGSGHITNDPIMHPGIRSGWNGSFRGTTYGARLTRWFGGEPVEPDDPPPPPSDGSSMTGEITVHHTDGSNSKFLISGFETQ